MADYNKVRRPRQRRADEDPRFQYLSRNGEPIRSRRGGFVESPWAFDRKRWEAWQRARNATRYAIGDLARQAMGDMVMGAIQALSESLDGLDMLITMDELGPKIDAGVEKVMKEEAKEVRYSILQSYITLIQTRERAPHYRVGDNRLPYAMRSVLGASDFVEATGTFLGIGNRRRLDAEARHWHRLAFGAGSAGGEDMPDFPDLHIGDSFIPLEMVEGPSPGFYMPRGRWVGPGQSAIQGGYSGAGVGSDVPRGSAPLGATGTNVGPSAQRRQLYASSGPRTGGGDEFYPGGGGNWHGPRMIPTKGIRGRNYFVAGLRRLADTMPAAIEEMVTRIVEEWMHSLQGGVETI